MPRRPNPDVVSLVIRLPVQLHQRATDARWQRRTSINQLVIEALTEYLRRPVAKPSSTKRGGS